MLQPQANTQFHQLTYRRGSLNGNARFTPDGKNIIYTAAWDGPQPELYTVACRTALMDTLSAFATLGCCRFLVAVRWRLRLLLSKSQSC